MGRIQKVGALGRVACPVDLDVLGGEAQGQCRPRADHRIDKRARDIHVSGRVTELIWLGGWQLDGALADDRAVVTPAAGGLEVAEDLLEERGLEDAVGLRGELVPLGGELEPLTLGDLPEVVPDLLLERSQIVDVANLPQPSGHSTPVAAKQPAETLIFDNLAGPRHGSLSPLDQLVSKPLVRTINLVVGASGRGFGFCPLLAPLVPA